jgi:magnesium transporter
MIHLHPGGTDLASATWIDLVSPTDDEVARVREATGLRAPPRDELAEIETSSRLGFSGGVFTLSTPMITHDGDGDVTLTPVGFVLGTHVLLTVRFAEIGAFDEARELCKAQRAATAEEALLGLFEIVVDKAADKLEHVGAECDRLSRATFREGKVDSKALRGTMTRIGVESDRISRVRDTLLGIGRIASFVVESGLNDAPKVDAERMRAIRTDVTSLTDYHAHLETKLQFLLDATLGFISIEQNEITKTLTIASVVGIPPVVVVGIYGMNFHAMPELSWPWGYPFALGLMVVSGLVPFLWFKRRGWM